MIELLVVIAVATFLAALLVPATVRARSSALRIGCVNNLRQIGISCREYLDDFHRYVTFARDCDPDARLRYWDAQLVAEGGLNHSIFFCPGNLAPGGSIEKNWSPSLPYPVTLGEPLPYPNRSYGYNGTGTASAPYPVFVATGYLGFGGEGWVGGGTGFVPLYLLESQVLTPSAMIAVADYDPLATDYRNGNDRHPEMLFLGIAGRHARGANVLWCDQHVEYDKVSGWTQRTDTALRRWNSDHRPHERGN